MLANKLFNSALKPLTASPLFAFSAKKKQIELTLRTPYRTLLTIQAPSFKISPASARSSPRTCRQLWSSRTEPPLLCTCCPLGS